MFESCHPDHKILKDLAQQGQKSAALTALFFMGQEKLGRQMCRATFDRALSSAWEAALNQPFPSAMANTPARVSAFASLSVSAFHTINPSGRIRTAPLSETP